MLKKARAGESGTAKVTFVLSPEMQAHHVHLAGDFNAWQSSTPMKRQKDGSWRATVELQPGRDYQFRYLVDGNYWVNDEAADGYVPNPFGADNSLLRVPPAAEQPAARGRTGSRRANGDSEPARKSGTRAGSSRSDTGDGSGRRGGGRSGRTGR
jgi:hypothetical protein